MFTVVAFSAGLSELSYKSVSCSRISVEKVLLDMKLKYVGLNCGCFYAVPLSTQNQHGKPTNRLS